MKKTTKALLLALCAVMLVAATVVGTLAYLTSQATVTNTFTVGDVEITMDESPVDSNGQATTGTRVTENEYKLIPGKTYDKDPIVHVDAESETAYLFIKVTNEISAIEATTKIHSQLVGNGWELVNGKTDVYVYETTVNAGDNINTFKTFKIDGTVDNETLAAYADKKIMVEAYAIQADGFADSAAAWTGLISEYTELA